MVGRRKGKENVEEVDQPQEKVEAATVEELVESKDFPMSKACRKEVESLVQLRESVNFDQRASRHKDLILVMKEGAAYILPCKVMTNHKIEYRWRGRKREVEVITHPLILTVNYRKMGVGWSGNLMGTGKYRMYSCHLEKEYTFDPTKDEFSEEDQRKLEILLGLVGKASKAKIVENFLEGLRSSKPWWEFVTPFVTVAVVVLMFLVWLNGYNLVKGV